MKRILLKKQVRNDLIEKYRENPLYIQDEEKENVFYPKKEEKEDDEISN